MNTHTGQTAPAPASGDVMVPRELLESLSSTRPHRFGCVCVFCEGIDRIKAILAAAPRPSGDVVAKREPVNITCDIVSRFAWTSNVIHEGRLVGQQYVVMLAIEEAIKAERSRIDTALKEGK